MINNNNKFKIIQIKKKFIYKYLRATKKTKIIKLFIYYFLNILSNCLISSCISLPLSFNLLFFLIIGINHQACSPIKIKISIIKSIVPGCTF